MSTLDSLWNKAIIGLAEIQPNGQFIRTNPAFCTLLGYTEPELLDKKVQDITHPDDVDGGKEMVQKILTGDVPGYTMEKRYITKRGQVIWITAYISPVVEKDGSIRILLKQVINSPIAIPAEQKPDPASNPNSFKDNYKMVVGAVIGLVLTLAGALIPDQEIRNMGTMVLIGLLGGHIAANGKK